MNKVLSSFKGAWVLVKHGVGVYLFLKERCFLRVRADPDPIPNLTRNLHSILTVVNQYFKKKIDPNPGPNSAFY